MTRTANTAPRPSLPVIVRASERIADLQPSRCLRMLMMQQLLQRSIREPAHRFDRYV
jgi:hypothetical protein